MAKKTKNNIDNSFDVDDDLNFDDFDFDFDPGKDDRKPITKVKDGFVSSFKSKSSDPSFLRKVLRDALPKGFGDAMDLTDTVNKSLRSLYESSANEVKPALRDFKRMAIKVTPKDNKYVPKSLENLVKKWEDESKESSLNVKEAKFSVDEMRDTALAAQLGELFKEQATLTQKNNEQDQAEDKIKQGIELARHRDVFGVLNQSNISLSKISQYQTNITLKYQKKNLELQHRQLFALQDILKLTQQTYDLQTESFKDVIKNTGLPDYQNIKLGEMAHQSVINKFIGKSQDFLGNRDFVNKLIGNIEKRTMSKIKENVSDFRSIMSEVESMHDDASMAEGSIDKHEMGGMFAGDAAAETLGSRGAKWFKKKYGNKSKKIQKVGNYLEDFTENLPRKYTSFKNDRSKYEYEDGLKAWFMRSLQDVLPEIGKADKSFYKTGTVDLDVAAPRTLRTDKTINEIIPGYLAMMLREMQIVRSGKNVNLMTYDHNKGKFRTNKKVSKDLAEDIFQKRDTNYTVSKLDKLIKELDPEGKLTPQQVASLRKTLLNNSVSNKEFNVQTMDSSITCLLYTSDAADE